MATTVFVLATLSTPPASPSVDTRRCAHDELVVYRVLGAESLDDTVTEQGHCRQCNGWISRTHWLSLGAIEDRALTPREIDRLQAIEDCYRRSDAR